MSTRITLQSAFVLHRRPFRDTSLLVDVITQQYGRIKIVARSARGCKSRFKGQLQLFTPLLISYSGRFELKSLSQVEPGGAVFQLPGDRLLCGFYLNELLVRLLKTEDACPRIFELYQHVLQQLDSPQQVVSSLRMFEKRLLDEIGYGLPLEYDAVTRDRIQADCHYVYVESRGFMLADPMLAGGLTYAGTTLINLANDTLLDEPSLQQAKRLLRQVIASHLGAKPLKSRDLMC